MSSRNVLAFYLFSLVLCLPLVAANDPWLDEVALLIGNAEREAYVQLPGDVERQEFIRRFWEVRDPFPQTERNEMQEAWTSRLAEARQRWDAGDDRSRALLLRGEPDSSFEGSCPGAPVYEFWVYEPTFQVKHRSVLIFTVGSTAKLWQPGPDAPKLHPPSTEGCTKDLLRESRWIFSLGDEQYRALMELTLARPRPSPRDWYTRLVAMPTEAPSAEHALTADLEVEYPARFEGNSVVRVLMTLPAGSLSPPSNELLVTGQVLQDRGVLEDFRYTFQIDRSQRFTPLVFERYLRPGLYKLRIKLVDLITKRFFLGERELSVPAFDPAMTASLDRLYEEADAALTASRPGVRLLRPDDKLVAGSTRFEARVEGPVSQVAFVLDGRRIYTRTRPPYAVTLDLGDVPRLQKLSVEGIGAGGEVLARDELILNSGAQRFAVRLLDPQPGKTYRKSLRARVQVEPPQGERVERVEVWFNEDRIATLHQPPYTLPILLPKGKEVGYVRAVAYLPDGRAAEDLVLLNTTAAPDAMAVRLVELFTTVLDGSGRPVQSVEPGIFSVLEDGMPQKVRIVEPVGETPIRVVTLIDNSLSMRDRLEQTREAALQFLQRTLRPVDQAAVITFNRTPRVAVRLTNDMEELREGLIGLLAEDQTSLYDSLAYGLQYLSGVKGQRAVLLLSDGMDRSSRLTFEQSLECARRAGIAVYTIGLGLPDGAKGEAGDKLHRMAAETGGRSYFVESTAELDGVYQQIERELRSQYRISYQSSNNSPKDGFRAVRVEVAQKGMEARTISGYYP